MESFALTTIENGGALGVLFVIFLLGFGGCSLMSTTMYSQHSKIVYLA